MTLTLPPDLERRVAEEAGRQGLEADAYALQLLEKHLPPEDRRAALSALLQSWIDADEEEASEQRETGEYLIRVLDADRLSDRELFPTELKGVTW